MPFQNLLGWGESFKPFAAFATNEGPLLEIVGAGLFGQPTTERQKLFPGSKCCSGASCSTGRQESTSATMEDGQNCHSVPWK